MSANNLYKPKISEWKMAKKSKKDTDTETNNSVNNKGVSDDEKASSVKKHFEFFNWTLSFTKNVVQASFILFVAANIFICVMMTISYFTSYQMMALDTYINKIFDMFISVIGGYIIKSATENTMKIGFSVLSDWVDHKYKFKDTDSSSDDYTPDDNGGSSYMAG